MKKGLKVCTAVRDKDFEDKIIKAIESIDCRHSFVNIDDIVNEHRRDTLFYIVEDNYSSILDLIELHNSCTLNFLPVVILSSANSKHVNWIKRVRNPEKYFHIKSDLLMASMPQIISTMDALRDTYQFKKISQFRDDVSTSFKSHPEFSGFINDILPRMLDLLYAERGSIMILNKNNNLVIEASTKKHLLGLEVEYKPDSVAWTVIDMQKPVFVENIEDDFRFQKGKGYAKDYFLSIPIFVNGHINGVLNLSDKIVSLLFDSADHENANNLIKILEPYLQIKMLVENCGNSESDIEISI
jgi:hypothetical protein